MIELFEKLVPIVALIVGWFLNELHHVFVVKQSHSAALRQALAQLLETRYQLKIVEHVVAEIKSRAPEVRQHIPQIRSFLEAMFGDEKSAADRYQSAIEVVAGSDPFIAFQLTSRNRIGVFFQQWRHMALSAGVQGDELEAIESELKQLLTPNLDESLVDIASEISWIAKRKTRQLISTKMKFPSELTDLLNKVQKGATTGD